MGATEPPIIGIGVLEVVASGRVGGWPVVGPRCSSGVDGSAGWGVHGGEQVVERGLPGPVLGQVQVDAAGAVGQAGGHGDDPTADARRAGGDMVASGEARRR